MPYPMAHLIIAKKMAALKPAMIKDLPQFYLGSLSPDAVHFRENFASDDKRVSHLCVGEKRWGDFGDTTAWTENVLRFLEERRESENIDFIVGYCTHILSDIRNSDDIVTPLKDKFDRPSANNAKIHVSETREALRADEVGIDKKLYGLIRQDPLWSDLEKSNALAIEGVIPKEEVDKIRDNVLYKQYNDVPLEIPYVAKYVSYETYLRFIDQTATSIYETLFRK